MLEMHFLLAIYKMTKFVYCRNSKLFVSSVNIALIKFKPIMYYIQIQNIPCIKFSRICDF